MVPALKEQKRFPIFIFSQGTKLSTVFLFRVVPGHILWSCMNNTILNYFFPVANRSQRWCYKIWDRLYSGSWRWAMCLNRLQVTLWILWGMLSQISVVHDNQERGFKSEKEYQPVSQKDSGREREWK